MKEALTRKFDSVDKAFAYLDKDGDGSITLEEIEAGLNLIDALVCARSTLLSGTSDADSEQKLKTEMTARLDAAGYSDKKVQRITPGDPEHSDDNKCSALVTFHDPELAKKLIAEGTLMNASEGQSEWAVSVCRPLEELETKGINLGPRELASLSRHMDHIGTGLRPADIKTVVKTLDVDGDGTVDLEEFKLTFDSKTAVELKHEVRSGQITMAEFKQGQGSAYGHRNAVEAIPEESESSEDTSRSPSKGLRGRLQSQASDVPAAAAADISSTDPEPAAEPAPEEAMAGASMEDNQLELKMAATNGDAVKLSRILPTGVDLEVAGADGHTALYLAANSGHAELVKMLADAGANVSPVAANTSFTPLHAAAQLGHVEVVIVLVEAGADVAAANKKGKTAHDLARIKKRQNLMDILSAAAAPEPELEPAPELEPEPEPEPDVGTLDRQTTSSLAAENTAGGRAMRAQELDKQSSVACEQLQRNDE